MSVKQTLKPWSCCFNYFLNKDKQFCPLEKGKFAVVNISMFWRTAYAIELTGTWETIQLYTLTQIKVKQHGFYCCSTPSRERKFCSRKYLHVLENRICYWIVQVSPESSDREVQKYLLGLWNVWWHMRFLLLVNDKALIIKTTLLF
jgi:hypothetical protein